MILSKEGIKQALQDGAIGLDPCPQEECYTTSAVDLTLGDQFLVWRKESLTAKGAKVELDLSQVDFTSVAAGFMEKAPLDSSGSLIMPPYRDHPWHFLAQTKERVFLSREQRIAARVEGRSSLARIGLLVHLTAPIIHCGFSGNITLEMLNVGPFHLKLPPMMRICQLVFERLETAPEGEPNTIFQGQETPAGGKAS